MDLKSIIHTDPDTMGGEVIFVGTRVPVAIFWEYLQGGYSLDEFLAQYPTVRPEIALALLDHVGTTTTVKVRPNP